MARDDSLTRSRLLAPGRDGGGGSTATLSTAAHGGQHLQRAPVFSQLRLRRETSRITNHVTALVWRHQEGLPGARLPAGRELAAHADSDHLACLWDLLEMAPLSLNLC